MSTRKKKAQRFSKLQKHFFLIFTVILTVLIVFVMAIFVIYSAYSMPLRIYWSEGRKFNGKTESSIYLRS